MNKQEFLTELKKRLSGIPKKDIDQTIEFYEELILDKMEEGQTEEEAIASLDSIDEIVKATLSNVSIPKLVKEKFAPKRSLKTWEIVVIASTAIIWIPLAIVLLSVILSLYVGLWSGVIALAASTISVGASSLIIVGGILDLCMGHAASGIFTIGLALAFLGTALLLGLLTFKLSKLMVVLCKKIILWIKSLFIKRGEKDEN
ncbi:MAG: DUF1700 domain-containing protein [Bacilli bacterium]|nr:DUF1700 domain-containing protein [Bacilli bacterium]